MIGVIKSIKNSSILKMGLICLLWIVLSVIDTLICNFWDLPFPLWNYFKILQKGYERSLHRNVEVCIIAHAMLVILFIMTIVFLVSSKRDLIVTFYLLLISLMIIIVITSFLMIHEDVSMFIGLSIEVVYGCCLSDEFNLITFKKDY